MADRNEIGLQAEGSQTREGQASRLPEVTIFISSPGDVGEEREIAARVIERLSFEFRARARLTPILWEHDPIVSTGTFQQQISRPSEADIVVCILWTRLGTRLPEGFETRADGSRYESGTAFEFEDAQASFDERGTPDLLAYRKMKAPHVSVDDPDKLSQFEQQWRGLQSFINRWFIAKDGTFKRGFHEFQSTDRFERKLTEHLRDLIAKRLTPSDDPSADITWSSGSPYRGLEVFEPEDAPIYFGRTRAVSEIIEQATARANAGIGFLPIFGMSGSGKSSLLRAGVIATLTGHGVVPGVAAWRYCIIRPSDNADIFLGVAQGLLAETALPGLAESGVNAHALAHTLRTSPESAVLPITMALNAAAKTISDTPAPGSVRLLIVLDQLEELFTSSAHDDDTRAALFRMINCLAMASTAPADADLRPADQIWFICAVRGDFYHRCVQVPGFTSLIGEHGPYHLLPPRPREIRDIILRPADAAGLVFEFDPDSEMFLDMMIEDEAIEAPHALPLLEFMLDELYVRRQDNRLLTVAAYKDLGGLNGALGRRADQVYANLPKDVRAALPQVLGLLVNPSSSDYDRATARTAPLSEFPEGSPQRLLIDALRDSRLLGYDEDTGDGSGESGNQDGFPDGESGETLNHVGHDPMVRVTHEALFSHWEAARAQIDQDKVHFRTLRRVEAAASNWLTRNKSADFLLPAGGQLNEAMELRKNWQGRLKPEIEQFVDRSARADKKRRSRSFRMAVAVAVSMSVVGVLAVGAAYYAFDQQARAERDRRVAMTAAESLVDTVTTGLGQATGVSNAMVESMLQESEGMLADLAKSEADAGWVNGVRARMLLGFADAYGKSGNDVARYENAVEAERLARTLVLQNPDDAAADLLGSAHAALGDALTALGQYPPAEIAYKEALHLRQILKSEQGAHSGQARKLAAVKQKLGDLNTLLNNHDDSFAYYISAMTDLTVLPTHDDEAQRDIMVTQNKISYAEIVSGRLEKARDGFKEALEIAKALSKRNTSKRSQRDLAIAFFNLGSLYIDMYPAGSARQRSLLGAARRNLGHADRITKDLTVDDPANAQLKHDQARIAARMGDLLMGRNVRAARLNYAYAAGLAGELVKQQPKNIRLWGDLAASVERLGDALQAEQRIKEAHGAYEKAIAMQAQISDHRPNDMTAKHILGATVLKRARLYDAMHDAGKTVAVSLRAVTILTAVHKVKAEDAAVKQDLAAASNIAAWRMVSSSASSAKTLDKAQALAEHAVNLTNHANPRYLDTLAYAHFMRGDRKKAYAMCLEALDIATEQLTPDARLIARHCKTFSGASN